MALDDVLATVRAACDDPAIGLARNLGEILAARAAAGVPPTRVPLDYHWERWTLAGAPAATTGPRCCVAPDRAMLKWRGAQPRRDGSHQLRFLFECFDADGAALEATVAGYVTALAMTFDQLATYARAHASPVQQLDGDIDVTYGQFSNLSTAAGFAASFTILERSVR